MTGGEPTRQETLARRRRELLIAGTGGFARETAQALAACAAAAVPGRAPKPWRLLGFLDDNPALLGTSVDDVPVLGSTQEVHRWEQEHVLLCVGNPRDHLSRMRLANRLDLDDERYATVVHPTASVSENSIIGPGSVVLAHCALTSSVWVGAHVAMMPRVVLTHDDVVEDYATLASGVSLGGGVRVEHGAYLGAGALVREGVSIGAGSVVGMGSVVLRDVPPGQVWVGNPARFLRRLDPPVDLNPILVSMGGHRA